MGVVTGAFFAPLVSGCVITPALKRVALHSSLAGAPFPAGQRAAPFSGRLFWCRTLSLPTLLWRVAPCAALQRSSERFLSLHWWGQRSVQNFVSAHPSVGGFFLV
ncbi:hypothetical protein T11_11774 [Trichinella zimbabwensis]|uniref:Uncharacterized protein n=1 Tax=Trichinella zimbabwensis TaxID=268475 RepID=A0A0V1GIZ4_9BILA|nr:hypothetical protein T11_11774 [Trichinella zimbabwensis]